MSVTVPAPTLVRRAEFSVDAIFARILEQSTHFSTGTVVVRAGVSTCKMGLIAPGDLIVVEKCGGCPVCDDHTWLLIRQRGKYYIEQKRDIIVRPTLQLVGAKVYVDTEIIGRLLGWLQP